MYVNDAVLVRSVNWTQQRAVEGCGICDGVVLEMMTSVSALMILAVCYAVVMLTVLAIAVVALM